jgi:hypothetical protein
MNKVSATFASGSQLGIVGGVLTCSSNGWDGIQRRAPIALPLTVLIAGTLAVQVLSRPLIRTVFLASVPSGWSDMQAEQALQRMALGQNLGLLVAPFLLTFKLLGVASVLFLFTIILNGDVSFKRVFSLVSIASLAPLAASWLSLAVLRLRPAETLRTLRDLQPPIGLSVLAPESPLPVFTLLTNVNPLEFLYVLIIATGIARLARISRSSGTLLAISVWALCTAVQVALVAAVGQG